MQNKVLALMKNLHPYAVVFDLRMDPFERAQHDSNTYYEWMEGLIQFIGVPAQAAASKMIASMVAYPPRQKPASFNLDEVMSSLTQKGDKK